MKRKFRLSTGLVNLWSWLRRPAPLLGLLAFFSVFGLLLSLISPCGRYDSLVNGVCGDGQAPASPLFGALISSAVILLVMMPVMMSEKLEPKDGRLSFKAVASSVRKSYAKIPKWRRRLFPMAFTISYTPIAVLVYFINSESGFRWYNYVGIYGVLLPMVAAGLANTLLRKWRSYSKQHGRR